MLQRAVLPDQAAIRAHRLLIGLYCLAGITVASWLSRLPSIRLALDLTTAELGSVLLVGSLGSLLTVLAAGVISAHYGSRQTLTTAAALFSVAVVVVAAGPALGSVPVLAAGCFLFSSSFALANIPMSLETVVIERQMGRTVVPHFHAAFSVGAVVGSLLGALVSWLGVSVLAHFAAMSAVALLWRLATIPGAVLPVPAELTRPRARASLSAWRERRVVLIGVIVLGAALSEGAANNWLTIAVVDGFAQREAVAAVVFGFFVGAMTVGRLLGARLIDRFGTVSVLTASVLSSLLGLVLFGLAPVLPVAVLGVAAWGAGAALVFPIASAAVARDRLQAPGRIAVIATFASVASMVAPPLLGLLADVVGTRHALLVISVALAVGLALTRNVSEPDAALPSQRSLPGQRSASAEMVL